MPVYSTSEQQLQFYHHNQHVLYSCFCHHLMIQYGDNHKYFALFHVLHYWRFSSVKKKKKQLHTK